MQSSALTEGLAEAGTIFSITSVPCSTPGFSCGGFRLLQVARRRVDGLLQLGARDLLSALTVGRSLTCDGQRLQWRRWHGRTLPPEAGQVQPGEPACVVGGLVTDRTSDDDREGIHGAWRCDGGACNEPSA